MQIAGEQIHAEDSGQYIISRLKGLPSGFSSIHHGNPDQQAYPDLVIRHNEALQLAMQTEDWQPLQEIRQQALELIPSFLGEARDDRALSVEQGEIGYTHGRIGTGSVYDCLCVAVRDPDSAKVALAHVDSSNSVESMERIFDRLPERRPPQVPYQVRLVGAGFSASIPDEERNPDIEENIRFSARNLHTVLDALRKKHVDIISADILDRNQPKSLVINAGDFSMSAIKPAKNQQQPLRHGKAFIGYLSKKEDSRNMLPLRIVFDASYAPHNAPLFLSGAEVGKLRELFHGKQDKDVYQWFMNNTRFPESPRFPVAVEEVIRVRDAYAAAWKEIEQQVDEKFARLPATETVNKLRLLDEISAKGLYIGPDAEKGNAALKHAISAWQGKDISSIERFRFDEQPYHLIIQ